jgi:hypothetical protein
MTLSQLDPSENAPWISTTVFGAVSCAIAIEGSIIDMRNSLIMVYLLNNHSSINAGKSALSFTFRDTGGHTHIFTRMPDKCDYTRSAEANLLDDGIGLRLFAFVHAARSDPQIGRAGSNRNA